jgi:hypothetical protein
MPANAGIQVGLRFKNRLDSGFRRNHRVSGDFRFRILGLQSRVLQAIRVLPAPRLI